MNPYNNNNNLKREELSFENFLNHMLNEIGEKIFTTENRENTNNKIERAKIEIPTEDKKDEYIPQIGDEVYVLDYVIDGESKRLIGDIVADVELYDCYQVKISEINAIYVPKNLVKVIKKKEEKISGLEEELDELFDKQRKLLETIEKSESEVTKLNKSIENKHNELRKLKGKEEISYTKR
ncbi:MULTISPECIES: hypothetical protein [unclassified Clostridium]|uniref:hypothetical protein n=1 Tax=unclassified Clostridium TaxID=2614128 RepID=UPI0025C0BD54|nr:MULTISPECIES: hypothetical protein [unclassified Clostridium]